LERTVVLRDGHYEMALPLKDRGAPVPNNIPQVEQRACWLKKKLQRNKDFYNDYKCFMTNIIDKGYAHTVLVDLLDARSKKWYIPHHSIYHPHKPARYALFLTARQNTKASLSMTCYSIARI